jgi:hypothetical protein
VNIDEEDQHKHHQKCVEQPHEPFVAENVPSIAGEKFDDSENGSYHYKCAGHVERVEMSFPGHRLRAHSHGRDLSHPIVEGKSDHDEKSKKQNLDEETPTTIFSPVFIELGLPPDMNPEPEAG